MKFFNKTFVLNFCTLHSNFHYSGIPWSRTPDGVTAGGELQ